MGLKNLNIKLIADLSQFSTAMQNAERQLKGVSKKMESAGKSMSTYLTLPIIGFGTIAASNFIEAESNLVKLNAAIQANGKELKPTLKQYEAFASEMQDLTVIEDDAIIGFLQLAESMNAPNAQEAVKNAIGLSRAYGIDMDAALKAVVKGQEGQYMALGKLIPSIKNAKTESEKAALANKIYADAFQVAQAETESNSGALLQLKNSLGNATEAIGRVIVTALKPLAEWLKGVADWFQTLSDDQIKWITGILAVVAAIGPLLLIGSKMVTMFFTLQKAFITVKTAMAALNVTMLANPIVLIVASVAALIAGFIALVNYTGGVGNAFKLMGAVAIASVKTIWEYLKAYLSFQINVGKLLMKILITPFKVMATTAVSIFKALPKALKEALTGNFKDAGKILFEAIKDPVSEQTQSLIDDFKKLGDPFVQATQNTKKYWAEVKTLNDQFQAAKKSKDALTKDTKAAAKTSTGGVTSPIGSGGGTLSKEAIKNKDEELKLERLKAEKIKDGWEMERELARITFEEKKLKYQKETEDIKVRNQLISAAADDYKKELESLSGGVQKVDIRPLKESLTDAQDYANTHPVDLSKSFEWPEIEARNFTEEQQAWMERVASTTEEFNNRMKELIYQFKVDVVTNMAQAFGSLITDSSMSGASKWKKMLGVFLGLIADFASNMGKMLIGVGVSMEAFKESLQSLNPYVAIAAGIALSVASAALKSYINQGVEGFADGGIVGGSSFSGDRVPAMVNSGEMILNRMQQGKLFNMINSGGSGNSRIQVEVVGKVSGQDIRLSNLRATNKYNRI